MYFAEDGEIDVSFVVYGVIRYTTVSDGSLQALDCRRAVGTQTHLRLHQIEEVGQSRVLRRYQYGEFVLRTDFNLELLYRVDDGAVGNILEICDVFGRRA